MKRDETLKSLRTFAERAYLRTQAGDILTRCIDEYSSKPIQQLVEALVVAGPSSLSTLREILAETHRRRLQLEDDRRQIYDGLTRNLEYYAVPIRNFGDPQQLADVTPGQFVEWLRQQGIRDDETLASCLQLFHDSRELVEVLNQHIALFEEIKSYLQDWMFGVAYHSVRIIPDQPRGYPSQFIQ
jgi:hypothetical protein